MTAPGNSALVFALMAVFVACAAYAVGRLHQRYQMERDREDAYRDGYDTATRSIFSLAARLIAPRRGSRPLAQPVVDGSLVPDPGAGSVSALTALSAFADPALVDPALVDPDLADRALVDPALIDPAALADRALADRGLVDPAFADAGLADRALADPSGTNRAMDPAGPDPAFSPPEVRRIARRSPPPSESDAASLGFPVPPPAPPHILGEPAALGGVVYRPFPDPRLVGNSEPLPADRGAPTGRHTVPDELVQSPTYRLPPDRVFRARVPDSAERPALPDDPTTRTWVPKPRQS